MRCRRCHVRFSTILFAFVLLLVQTRRTTAADCYSTLEYWMISTRGLACYHGETPDPTALSVQRHDADCGSWKPCSLTDWQTAVTEAKPTWILIHGNRTEGNESAQFGWAMSRALANGISGPVRVVIWSWPSDQIHGQIDDVRAKAARTTTESIYLARWLGEIPATTPTALIGHSFGVRIATGALHLHGGGGLHGYQLPTETTRPLELRLLGSAAALHSNWLLPGSVHGQALSIVDGAVLLNNSCDPALKRYRFIDCNRPSAVGYSGAALTADQNGLVRQWDAAGAVGKSHDYQDYLRSGWALARLREGLPNAQ